MSSFDVWVFAIRRRPGRKSFEVRWRVAGRDRSRSFMTRALADSYRAEPIRAARTGLVFAPETGEPAGFQNSATGPDLGFYAERSYSLTRPPTTGRRLIRSWERSAMG